MNKAYKTVWNEALGGWVAVSERERTKGKATRGGCAAAQTVDAGDGRRAPRLKHLAVSVAAATGLSMASAGAWAGDIVNCSGNTGTGSMNGGQWVSTAGNGVATGCNGGTGVGIASGNQYLQIGQIGSNAAGSITLYSPGGITLNGTTDLNKHKITGVQDGLIGANSMDAINGGQLFKITGSLASISTGLLNSLSTSLSTAQSGVNSLSTGLVATNSNLASLSTSVGNGINSLSTGLAGAQTSIGSLSTGLSNAVQYDPNSNRTRVTLGGASATAPVKLTNVAPGVNATDAVNFGQFGSLSTSASTGIFTVQSRVNSLSTGFASVSTGISTLSTTLVGANSTLGSLSTSTSTSVGALTTSVTGAQSGVNSLSTGLANLNNGLAAISSSVPHYVSVTGDGTTTQGNYANDGARAPNSVAIGANAVVDASAAGGVALGYNATAGHAGSVALGSNAVTAAARPTGNAPITIAGISYGSFAGNNATQVVSVGGGVVGGQAVTRQITNVAAGQLNAASTDAVNGSQLYQVASAVGTLSTSASTGIATALSGVGSLSTGIVGLNSSIGSLSTSTSTSIGALSSQLTTVDSRIGSLSTGLTTTNSNVAAISTSLSGSRHYVSVNDGGTHVGNYDNVGAQAANSVAIGPNAVVSASASGAVALGYGASAGDANAVALGANAVTRAAVPTASAQVGGITYSGFAGASPGGVVSVGGGTVGGQVVTRQIVNVAAGQVAQTSTDAINGSQLYAVANEVATLSTTLANTNVTLASISTGVGGGGGGNNGGGNNNGGVGGNGNTGTSQGGGSSASGNGGSSYGNNSTASGDGSSSYGSGSTASGTNGTAIGSHSTASGDGSTAVGAGAVASGVHGKADGYLATASGNNSTALGANATASGANAVALGAGSIADQDNTVSLGSPGHERRLTNVAPGINGTDAVNMNQLNAVQSSITDVARRAYSGIAAATALTMIPEVDPGKKIAVGIAGGGYQGYGASALGVNVRLTENIKMKAGVGISAAGQAYGGGVSYQW
ncbi:hypothetical protein WS67_01225 [Burkholderia singularis]|uniref:CELL SURFACE PROTEIN n=1 Tax=Burkholderia singularis TaxID=1503053 RepID=A0A103DWW9_9BURK|nr:YadA-like family protein [Burkholderia singularis]KVE24213.1 hypothetical protein WS67_01225 [Burkholderia singularis]